MVAGSVTLPGAGSTQGFIWHEGAVTYLTPLANAQVIRPQAINDAGQVVGTAGGRRDRQVVGFVWDGQQMFNLGTLDHGPWATPLAINNHGVIVGHGHTPEDGQRAMIVIDGHMHRLEERVANRDDWVLYDAVAIDDRGVIVGNGYHKGRKHAFRLVPVSPP